MIRPLSRHTVIAFSVATTLALSACSSSDDDDGNSGNALDSGGSSIDPSTSSGPAGGSQPSPTIDLVPDDVVRTSIGDVFVSGENNLTLYTRPGDAPNTVTCTNECATTWPPVLTDVTMSGISGQFDVIDRGDGTMQWMLKGFPLHFHTGDGNEGEINGQAVDNAWYVARPDPITSGETALGETLVVSGTILDTSGDPATRIDADGRTLYKFDNDTDGVSNCNDVCANTWPPLYADTGAANFDRLSVISRSDNTMQWAHEGRPLYLYSGDSVAGDVNGDSLEGWTAVRQ